MMQGISARQVLPNKLRKQRLKPLRPRGYVARFLMFVPNAEPIAGTGFIFLAVVVWAKAHQLMFSQSSIFLHKQGRLAGALPRLLRMLGDVSDASSALLVRRIVCHSDKLNGPCPFRPPSCFDRVTNKYAGDRSCAADCATQFPGHCWGQAVAPTMQPAYRITCRHVMFDVFVHSYLYVLSSMIKFADFVRKPAATELAT